MCGIAGIYTFKENASSFKKKVEDAVGTLSKRGPDNTGVYSDDHVVLGHARLSIIDVTNAASQPFTDVSGRYTIIYNGEFYNFREHKNELLKKGITFRSNSDTEVLLYLYITEGPSFLEKINGFFAFAIYDNNEKTLFLARDRMGIKPLLYYFDDEKLVFASEMKALLKLGIPKVIDEVSLFEYLQFNYIPAPFSIFNNVKKLAPGNFMQVNARGIQTKEYYKIPFKDEIYISEKKITYDQAKTTLGNLLEASVQKRLTSDVPLGAFLSGGIDSSVIVALASKYSDRLNTFSIGYKDEPMFDETHYARLVAEKFKTNHTVFSLANDDIFSVLYDVLDYTDEPFADSSALAVYILSKHTRSQVTVALSGDGADEMFAGYNKHMAEYMIRNAGAKEKMVGALNPLWKNLPQSRNWLFSNKIRQLGRFSEGMKLNAKDRYWRWCAFANENEAGKLMLKKCNSSIYSKRKSFILENINASSGINDMLFTDMHMVLQNDMLSKVDMMSMANSLEVRTPFLDFELVNFVFSLPSGYKIDWEGRKKILRDAYRDILPSELYTRKKHGFEVPLIKWFRKELKSLIFNDLLDEEFVKQQGIFDFGEIEKIRKKFFSSNPGDTHARIWGLTVFQYWWKKYFL
ncbi:MAG: asparagine synthase (glutamine-hydrolyzing) [Bacteroidota bacterium]